MIGGENQNGHPAEITVSNGNGLLNETTCDPNAPIHVHIHFPDDLVLEEGQLPVFNINVNISKSDFKPNFQTEIFDFPETVGGGASMGDVNPPGEPEEPDP